LNSIQIAVYSLLLIVVGLIAQIVATIAAAMLFGSAVTGLEIL
jgi:hypothetical protein